jgi:AcrR family transcriptional regulator
MRTDPRVARSRASILDACAEVLAEEGFSGVTIEAVAARSGAAKTTIYRHWDSREALMIEAFGACSGPPGPPPATGSVREDVRAVLTGLAAKLNESDWRATMCSLLDAASRDEGLARLHVATVAERRRPLTDALERGIASGELPADLDVEQAVAMIAGPLFYRAMVSREPLDAEFIGAVVAGTLPAPRAAGDRGTPSPDGG